MRTQACPEFWHICTKQKEQDAYCHARITARMPQYMSFTQRKHTLGNSTRFAVVLTILDANPPGRRHDAARSPDLEYLMAPLDRISWLLRDEGSRLLSC